MAQVPFRPQEKYLYCTQCSVRKSKMFYSHTCGSCWIKIAPKKFRKIFWWKMKNSRWSHSSWKPFFFILFNITNVFTFIQVWNVFRLNSSEQKVYIFVFPAFGIINFEVFDKKSNHQIPRTCQMSTYFPIWMVRVTLLVTTHNITAHSNQSSFSSSKAIKVGFFPLAQGHNELKLLCI